MSKVNIIFIFIDSIPWGIYYQIGVLLMLHHLFLRYSISFQGSHKDLSTSATTSIKFSDLDLFPRRSRVNTKSDSRQPLINMLNRRSVQLCLKLLQTCTSLLFQSSTNGLIYHSSPYLNRLCGAGSLPGWKLNCLYLAFLDKVG